MEKRGFQLYFRDLAKERLSAAELEKLIGNRDYTRVPEQSQRALSAKEDENKSAHRAAKRFA